MKIYFSYSFVMVNIAVSIIEASSANSLALVLKLAQMLGYKSINQAESQHIKKMDKLHGVFVSLSTLYI